MKSSAIKETIADAAAEIARLHARIHETVRFRDASPQQRDSWKRACSEFHSRYSTLAFPGGYEGAIERILDGDQFSIEAAICFLEVRPYFFRSGYMFSQIVRIVRRANLSPEQELRFRSVIERQALWRAKRLNNNET